jgi:hypothetical protein
MSPIATALLSVALPAAAAAQENRTATPIGLARATVGASVGSAMHVSSAVHDTLDSGGHRCRRRRGAEALKLRTIVALGALVTLASGAGSARGGLAAFNAEDALQRSFAAYAALTAYADSGTVVDDAGGFKDKYTFRTYFTRQPRNLFLDFSMIESEYTSGYKIKSDYEMLIWMENGLLQTYLRTTQEHETYPEDGGRQVEALKSATYGTKGVSVIVPSLLYTKAGLASVIQATEEATAAGRETVDGRPCLKVMGIERWRYPSGQVTGVRPVTIWIDAETYLIRRIFEDTPKGMLRGAISRRTTTFHPHANPSLDRATFRYTVPE